MATSRTEANKRWQSKNREKTNYQKSKSACKSFIKNKATKDDIEEIKILIEEKLNTKE